MKTLNVTSIINMGGNIIDKDKKTMSVHVQFSKSQEVEVRDFLQKKIDEKKFRSFSNLPSAFDDNFCVLIFY